MYPELLPKLAEITTNAMPIMNDPIGCLPPSAAVNEANDGDLCLSVDKIRTFLTSAKEHSLQTLMAFRDAGQLLQDAKVRMRRGSFKTWVENSFSFKVRTAQRYIRIANEWSAIEKGIESGECGDMSLRAVLQYLRKVQAQAGNDSCNDDAQLKTGGTTSRSSCLSAAVRLIKELAQLKNEFCKSIVSTTPTVNESDQRTIELVDQLLGPVQEFIDHINDLEPENSRKAVTSCSGQFEGQSMPNDHLEPINGMDGPVQPTFAREATSMSTLPKRSDKLGRRGKHLCPLPIERTNPTHRH